LVLKFRAGLIETHFVRPFYAFQFHSNFHLSRWSRCSPVDLVIELVHELEIVNVILRKIESWDAVWFS
jgi:hypothetical protein